MKKLSLLIIVFLTVLTTQAQIMNSDSPCRIAGGKIWDIQRQISFFQNHMKIEGTYYEKTDFGWSKSDVTPPLEYNYKIADSDTNWCRTNVVSSLSWFRISGWVSYIDNIDGQNLIFINTWDSIKNRRVPTYCLYGHPQFSTFHINDRIDCMSYYTAEIHPLKTIRDNIEYESVEFGLPDTISELSLLPLPKETPEASTSVSTVEENFSSPVPINGNTTIELNNARLQNDFSFSFTFEMRDYDNSWPILLSTEHSGISIGIVGRTSGGSGVGTLSFLSENGRPAEHNWIFGTPFTIAPNIKYTVLITKNSSVVSLYVNGNLAGAQQIYNPIFPYGSRLLIGHGDNPSLRAEDTIFHGNVSNVKFYPSCISPSNVK